MQEELKEFAKGMNVHEVSVAKETSLKMPETFNTAANTKKVNIDPNDPSKQLTIGDRLNDA